MLLNMSETDWELLQRYRRNQAEAAFTELVRRHVNLVYSAALRQIRAPQLAEEIAQSVFSDLAQQAAQLPADTVLAAWLHQVTRRAAIDVVRREARRQLREQIATEMNATNAPDANWTSIEPLLDEAVSALDDADRAAVLLRYFENKSLRDVGTQLGISDDAAQKRVSRAVERLREFFAQRGVTVGASGLAVVISANAVQAAPAALVAAISTATVAAGAVLATTTITTQTTMNWITAKSISAIIAAAVAAGTGTYLAQQHTANQLRTENQKLLTDAQALTAERDEALAAVANHAEESKRRDADKTELLRLRGEVGQLRRRVKESEQLAAENQAMRQAIEQAQKNTRKSEEEELDPERRLAKEQIDQSRQLVLGLIMYAGDNQGVFPAEFKSIANYFKDEAYEQISDSFELVLPGVAMTNVPNPSATIAVRSKSPFFMNGKPVKVYGFADGHSELKREPEEGFEAWEKARIISSQGR